MVLGYFHMGTSLTKDKIAVLSKAFILKVFHRNIRLWYIDNQLPQKLLEDEDIKPYYTPCDGHVVNISIPNSSTDVIDGVLGMQAYCMQCRKNLSKYNNCNLIILIN